MNLPPAVVAHIGPGTLGDVDVDEAGATAQIMVTVGWRRADNEFDDEQTRPFEFGGGDLSAAENLELATTLSTHPGYRLRVDVSRSVYGMKVLQGWAELFDERGLPKPNAWWGFTDERVRIEAHGAPEVVAVLQRLGGRVLLPVAEYALQTAERALG